MFNLHCQNNVTKALSGFLKKLQSMNLDIRPSPSVFLFQKKLSEFKGLSKQANLFTQPITLLHHAHTCPAILSMNLTGEFVTSVINTNINY